MKRSVFLTVYVFFMAAFVTIWATGMGPAVLASVGRDGAADQQPGTGAGQSTTKWPPQFPRPGATKILENDQVIVWDDYLTSYDHFHKHIHDIVVIDIQGAPDLTTTPDGKVSIEANRAERIHPLESLGRSRYFEAGIGPHSEVAINLALPQRSLFIELKKTLRPDAVQWSTDPTGVTTSAFPLFKPPQPPVLPTVNPTQKKWPSLGGTLEAAGAIKTVDNDRVTIWDETLTTTRHSQRKNIRDVVAVQIWDGVTTLINGEGGQEIKISRGAEQKPPRRMPSVFSLKAGTGPYSQAAADPRRPVRTVWVELKGTEAPACKAWSTDPACK